MTDGLTTYELADGIATITLDDGKVNALSPELLASIGGRLDRAEADEAVVVLTGRERTFSAGFDLRSDDWPTMLTAGARTAERMLTFPRPVVVACTSSGATAASRNPAAHASSGSRMTPVTAQRSKAGRVSRWRARAIPKYGRVRPIATSLSPILKSPRAPTR